VNKLVENVIFRQSACGTPTQLIVSVAIKPITDHINFTAEQNVLYEIRGASQRNEFIAPNK
jgi:hypothetical protein